MSIFEFDEQKTVHEFKRKIRKNVKSKKVRNFRKTVHDFKQLFTVTINVYEFKKRCSHIETKNRNKTEKITKSKIFLQIEKTRIKMKREKEN